MLFENRPSFQFFAYLFGIYKPHTQTSKAERQVLQKYAANKKAAVEIGVYQGVTASELTSVIHPEGKYYAIDPYFKNRLGFNFNYLIAKREVAKHAKCKVVWLAEFGHNVPKQNKVENKFIDFIFIDGDHSYEGLKRDWEAWRPLIGLNGIVALHDTVGGKHMCQKYMEDVILNDSSFKLIEQKESLSVLERVS